MNDFKLSAFFDQVKRTNIKLHLLSFSNTKIHFWLYDGICQHLYTIKKHNGNRFCMKVSLGCICILMENIFLFYAL